MSLFWVRLKFCMANQGHFNRTKTGLMEFDFQSVCRNTPMSITFPLFHEHHAFQEVSVLLIKVYKARSLKGLYVLTSILLYKKESREFQKVNFVFCTF